MRALRPRPLWLALALVVAGEAVVFAVLLPSSQLHDARMLVTISAPLWAISVWLVARVRLSTRVAALLVLGVGAMFQLIAVSSHPSTSDDDFRYVWDAKVQLSGVDPYRYAPSAPELAQLREPFLFGPDCTHQFQGGCTSINRPDAHTIYPPVAEAAFVALRVASFGGHGGHLPLQLAGALGSLLVGWLLLRRSRSRPWLAVLWTWCPVVVIEYGNNAHIDWLAVLLVVIALAVLSTRTVWSAGALIGAAIAVKLYPLLVLPSLMRRSWLAAVAAGTVVAVVYVPHVVAVGSAVVGYLPGYLHEEQYGSGGRLLLLGAVLPHPVDTVAGVMVMGAVAFWAWRYASGPPQRSAVVVIGVAFLVFTPSYGWYAGLLLALVALTGAIEWVPMVFAPTYAYLNHGGGDERIYAVAALATGLLAVIRHRDSLRGCLPPRSRGTVHLPSSLSMPRR
jgi:alpha-1,2-mannosyltransferase